MLKNIVVKTAGQKEDEIGKKIQSYIKHQKFNFNKAELFKLKLNIFEGVRRMFSQGSWGKRKDNKP